jgi:manganese efflux pump family protein
MTFWTSLLIGLGLAMDAFAVSLGVGTSGTAIDARSKFRLAFHFGIFQAGMTLLGWLAGSTISAWIASWDHWLALGLLSYVGINMIRSGLNPEVEIARPNPSKGGTLIMLCVATSLDALAVGLSLSMLAISVLSPAAIIGLVTFALSGFGLLAGGKLNQQFGKRMEIIGGLILLGIGLQVLIADLY